MPVKVALEMTSFTVVPLTPSGSVKFPLGTAKLVPFSPGMANSKKADVLQITAVAELAGSDYRLLCYLTVHGQDS